MTNRKEQQLLEVIDKWFQKKLITHPVDFDDEFNGHVVENQEEYFDLKAAIEMAGIFCNLRHTDFFDFPYVVDFIDYALDSED